MSNKYLLIIFIIIIIFSCTAKQSPAKIKKSSLAGRWYSADSAELSGQIDDLLKTAAYEKKYDNPLLLILPHAGYQYSGKTAAYGYRAIGTSGKNNINPDVILILGPSHYKAFRGCAVISADFIETPLGNVKINRKIANRLVSEGFIEDTSAFDREHSVEIHLPFLQRIFGDRLAGAIQILPILVGDLDKDGAERFAGKIASAVAGSRSFFIVSSDFTHYGPDFGYMPFKNNKSTNTSLRELDSGAIDFIIKKDLIGFSKFIDKTEITICGRNPIKIALALPIADFKSEKIYYDTSGNITGDYTNSVSYASILFCGSLKNADKEPADSADMTPDDKKFLLKTARENIASWLMNGKGIILPKKIPNNCMRNRGAFVTLQIRGDLRGCIGYVVAEKPLIQTILENSYNAAFRDPRFMPLRAEELKDVAIEISVLTEPVPVGSINEIRTGRDGLIIEKGMHRGLLLPQVAVEQGWDRDAFLSNTCLKANLPPASWKDSATKIYKFQAIVFGEEDLK